MVSSPGRPRRASRELLQEAAFELFQLRGYRGTSVEQIARLAGFSRATFFNFFSSKAELFWLETDTLIAGLRAFLEGQLGREDPPPLEAALLEFSGTLSSAEIPWALQNYSLLEAADDLVASGASRVMGVNHTFLQYLRQREDRLDARAPEQSLALAVRAAATSSLLVVALLAWIDAGVTRGSLRGTLELALAASAQAPARGRAVGGVTKP